MINPMSMEGKTVMVTGASSNIGRDAAVFLSEMGAKVILVARRAELLEETRLLMHGDGHVVAPYDLELVEEIPAWMKHLTGVHGPLDGLLHSAGTIRMAPVQMLKAERIEKLLRVNLTSAMMLAKGMRQKGSHRPGSSIVFVSSVSALQGHVGRSEYSASKGALISLSKVLAREFAGIPIRVNCLAPGVVDPALSVDPQEVLPDETLAEMKRLHVLGLGKPRQVSYCAGFLMAETGGWITGETLVVDGGYSSTR
jgi:NAD(P)-dependent dehydrogenase (short-subunit alcohol dehydrogenase family)